VKEKRRGADVEKTVGGIDEGNDKTASEVGSEAKKLKNIKKGSGVHQ